MKGNLLGLLGICRKAGKLKLGFDPAAASLGRDAQLLLFTADVSPKTRMRMLNKAEGLSVKSLDMTETSDAVYYAIGKRVAVMAVTDKGLAERAAALHSAGQQAVKNSDNAVNG
ncbi:MAG: ribosomal protein L7ae [Oscillospiraceae bacterium]|nr:ribosomal protein L7ae [Oscillospiraceae bacterium]